MGQVAERAGVHKSTVSRALKTSHGPVPGVGEDVVQRVRRIAAELGYRPDPIAASLRTRRAHAIGVLIPRLTDVVLATIFEGIDDVVSRAGYQSLVASTGDDIEERQRRLDLLLSRRCDGFIIGDAHLADDEIAGLKDRGVPFLLVNRRAPGHVSVTCADVAGGRLVGAHLYERGHRHIGIVGGHPWASTALDRAHGCRSYLAERNVHLPDTHLLQYGFDVAAGRKAAEALLNLTPRPTAIFAVNDYSALGAMATIRDRGLAVGKDVAVVGFNDTDMASDLPIPLTSVDSQPRHMGSSAAHLLLKQLAGETVESLEIEPILRPRMSSDLFLDTAQLAL
ncbi:LacI family DNA-binding transcriptional regulator [Streptomyces sp. NPDC013457]|uniref:LacI family DNA-binding transcriptional regulator n=1 Tax=Streptomyces sp. NPDC013457 TaxID=3364866 RepID=UPI003701BB89